MTGPGSQEIRWGEWKPALRIPHIDPSCETCGFPGPLETRYGHMKQPGFRIRKLTVRSNVAEGVRPKAVTKWVTGYWALTHFAFRCPECAEELVYGYSATSRGDLVEIPDLGRPARFSQQVLPFSIPVSEENDDECSGSAR